MIALIVALPCNCVWRGTVLSRGCRQSEQIRQELEILRQNGQTRSDDWYSLCIELGRDHTP